MPESSLNPTSISGSALRSQPRRSLRPHGGGAQARRGRDWFSTRTFRLGASSIIFLPRARPTGPRGPRIPLRRSVAYWFGGRGEPEPKSRRRPRPARQRQGRVSRRWRQVPRLPAGTAVTPRLVLLTPTRTACRTLSQVPRHRRGRRGGRHGCPLDATRTACRTLSTSAQAPPPAQRWTPPAVRSTATRTACRTLSISALTPGRHGGQRHGLPEGREGLIELSFGFETAKSTSGRSTRPVGKVASS